MDHTIRTIRIFFMLLCVAGGALAALVIPEWQEYFWRTVFIGLCIGACVVSIDILLKGFSLRGLSALTFGLFVGWAAATLFASSPLFDIPFNDVDPLDGILAQNMYLIRLALFIVLMYLGAVIALRGRDEFNLVIPYVRFVPHGVDVPLVVVDTSALIDARIVGICESRFMGYALVIPQFVINELHSIADSNDPVRKAKGRKGLASLNRLREMRHLDLRINDSQVDDQKKVDAKLIFLAQSLKAKLLTTDYNLAQVAEFHNIEWLNLTLLSKALNPETTIGEVVQVELVKPGKEADQAVGYLSDGSMVVVADGKRFIGKNVQVEIQGMVPSSGGKLVFGKKI